MEYHQIGECSFFYQLFHLNDVKSQECINLREQLEQVKRKCNDIVTLDDQFQGKGADAIKNFYRAQIDVVEAWLRLIDRHRGHQSC
ncbi:T7SS effector LXG polymorphic toxin [Metabacillus bambusae]|uniref:LXG domain-containing protein n=1 Tax=Metabacillus bambusae TaxID=2795218 RepID=A0ABS3MZ87_9BACI|nr:T7SS effector LXG polymorphic toxin [Metabacillus bambusae]MBO1511189.1 hypothetical protein [Metabacillus bambusae]